MDNISGEEQIGSFTDVGGTGAIVTQRTTNQRTERTEQSKGEALSEKHNLYTNI